MVDEHSTSDVIREWHLIDFSMQAGSFLKRNGTNGEHNAALYIDVARHCNEPDWSLV